MRARAVMARHLLLLLLCLSGCSKTLYVEGVPNYYRVDVGIRRSGQPTTLKQWQTIWRDLESERPGRPHYVVKLNFDDEGSSDLATQAGFVLLKHPIQPAADKDVFDNLANTFVQPTDAEVDAIERATASGDLAAVADRAHMLKTSARMVGALRMGQLCEEIESCGLCRAAPACSAAVSGLAAAFASARGEIGPRAQGRPVSSRRGTGL